MKSITQIFRCGICLFLLFVFQKSNGQNVGISASSGFTPDASAALDISYTSKGLLVPRVALTATNAAGPVTSPATSLLVYNTATAGTSPNNVIPGYYYWSGSVWTALVSGAQIGNLDWSLTGNTGTTAGTNFLGTTDATDLVIKTNNAERARIVGTGSTPGNFIVSSTGTTTLNATNPEKLLVDAGTTSSYNVISGKGNLNSYLQLNIQNNNAGTGASSDVVATADDGNESTYYVDMGINSSANTANLYGGIHDAYLYNTAGSGTGGNFYIGTSTAAKSLGFLTGGSTVGAISGGVTTMNNERLRIDGTSGNVGVNTITPGQKLDVNGTIVSSSTTYPNYAYNSANRMAFGEPNVPGSETGSVVQFGSGSSGRNMLFVFTKSGVNSSFFGNDGTQTMIGSEGTNNSITFRTGLSYTSSSVIASGTEWMRIMANGNVGIGTTTPGYKLAVAGIVAPSVDNTYSLGGGTTNRWTAVYATNGAVQTSDIRLKKNIKPLKYGLKEVLALQPVSYNWKDKKQPQNKVGLIAQDVKKIVPEVVTGDEHKEKLGMNYAELVPVLINAIKDQQKQIDELKKQVHKLQK